jgi:hypothetical protein
MDQKPDKVGTGDPRLDDETPRGGAKIPGTPGYESEAAFRHREMANADMDEIRTNQLAPGPLREVDPDEPMLDPYTLGNSGDVKHHSR